MSRLPVSGIDVRLRRPTGVEDVFLREASFGGPALALALITRLASVAGGPDVDWELLPVTDVEALLLALRQMLFGDRITTDMPCPVEECGARMDVTFNIGDYLEHHRPRLPRGVSPDAEEGWFRLRDAAVSFRLPRAADQIAARRAARPAADLARRCVRPAGASGSERRRAENAMSALAPSLSQPLATRCPECGGGFDFYFDVPHFVLSELRAQAAYVYEDVHLIAATYHWPEAEILALPVSRRLQYAEMARSQRPGF